MAVVTSAVVSAGVGLYGAYQGYASAQEAKANLSEQEYARYLQAQSIDDQISSEEDLYGEEQGLLEAENAIAGDKLDLANRKAVSDLGYKGEELGFKGEEIGLKTAETEEGLKSGLEKTLMSGATSFRQSGEAGRAATAASGFSGAGTGQQNKERDAMNQMMFAQQQQTTQYGQQMKRVDLSQSMLDMEGRKLDESYDYQAESSALATEALDQQYEREQFGAEKDYQRAVGALEARQQELQPGYVAGA